mgnify:CR=1 FL=1
MKLDPYELHPEAKKRFEKKQNKLLTKENILGILDSEIQQFKRLDYMLMVGVLEKLRAKFDDLEEV